MLWALQRGTGDAVKCGIYGSLDGRCGPWVTPRPRPAALPCSDGVRRAEIQPECWHLQFSFRLLQTDCSFLTFKRSEKKELAVNVNTKLAENQPSQKAAHINNSEEFVWLFKSSEGGNSTFAFASSRGETADGFAPKSRYAAPRGLLGSPGRAAGTPRALEFFGSRPCFRYPRLEI